jgi:hypothetical protein
MSNAPTAQRAGWTAGLPGGPDGRGGAPPGLLAGLRGALHAEWTKLRTLPGTPWLAAAIVAATVPVSAAATAATRCPSGGCGVDPTKLSLTGVDLGQAVAAILAVLVISSEYSTGMIRITMTAVPRRVTVLAAKAAIVSGLVLVAGIIAVGGSLLAGHAILSGHGFTPAHGYPPLTLAHGPVLGSGARLRTRPAAHKAPNTSWRVPAPGQVIPGIRAQPRTRATVDPDPELSVPVALVSCAALVLPGSGGLEGPAVVCPAVGLGCAVVDDSEVFDLVREVLAGGELASS